ncbi:MAG: sugar ABC transporter substrate-binding protein [Limnochordaceae bacterium]|nr:sugar ABC transporter substrate-binding protein [Limnochordaceae bacterium]
MDRAGVRKRFAIVAALAAVGIGGIVAGGYLPAAQAKTTLVLGVYGTGDDLNNWNQVAKAFETRFPQYELKVQVSAFDEYPTKIVTQIATGTAPDVFMTWAQYKPKWVKEGLLLDVTQRWANSSKLAEERFYPAAVDAARYDGRMYGVPYDYNAMVWYVNTSILDQAGLPLPSDDWTVDQMRQISRKTLDPVKGISGPGIPLDWGWGPNIQWYYNWTGHEWLDETRTKVLVDDAKSLQMYDWWLQAAKDLKLPAGQGKGDFFGGYQSMWEGWFSYTRLVAQSIKAAKGAQLYDWTIMPYPKSPAGIQRNFAQGHMFSIPAASKRPDDAWKLAEWLASSEAQAIFARLKMSAPQVLSEPLWLSYLDYLPPDKLRDVVAFVHTKLYGGVGYARNFSYWTTFDEMNKIMIKHLTAIFQQGKSPSTEMTTAKEELQAVLKSGQ